MSPSRRERGVSLPWERRTAPRAVPLVESTCNVDATDILAGPILRRVG